MWADHFEELGTPDLHTDYDNNFVARVSAFVANFYKTCLHHPVGVLSEPLSYEEAAKICSSLKLGISGITLDYEHTRFAGPPLWHLLHVYTTTSISVRIGQFLSEQSRTQLVRIISTLVLSERRQILFHKIFNEGYQCHSDSVLIVLTLF